MSVERIFEYCQLEPEKQPEIPETVTSDWPTKGKIEFKDVFYRYSEEHEPVLKGLSFCVNQKEKVSIFKVRRMCWFAQLTIKFFN